MAERDPNIQRPPLWTPYGLVPYGEVSQEQMTMGVRMMNPMMNPMMMNPMMSQMMRGNGYGPVQFPQQLLSDEPGPVPDEARRHQPDDDWILW